MAAEVLAFGFTCPLCPKREGPLGLPIQEAHSGGAIHQSILDRGHSVGKWRTERKPPPIEALRPSVLSTQGRLSGGLAQELTLAVFQQCPEPEGSRLEERKTILTAACIR